MRQIDLNGGGIVVDNPAPPGEVFNLLPVRGDDCNRNVSMTSGHMGSRD
jgi:hypothetical protein